MISKYNSLRATLEDSMLVRKLLDSVPDKYLQLVASIKQYSDIDKMPFEEAIGRLKAYEDRLKLRANGTNTTENSLLLVKGETSSSQKNSRGGSNSGGRGRSSNHFDRGGRSGSRGRGRGRNNRGGYNGQRDNGGNYHRPKDKKHIKCFNCEKYGHYASECKGQNDKNDETNQTTTQEEEHTLLLTVCGEENNSLILLNEEKVFPNMYEDSGDTTKKVWYLDNGASNHMTNLKSAFAELDENKIGQVGFGDGSKVTIAGKVLYWWTVKMEVNCW
ncbi:uncharacterized protein [Rutidosis leptorrhynchoides]|uniref:uncharacterized protein n=1 Tax=Rutidosis leptorrhynchoides TaxID=125765 RepID=UPI003A9975C3